MFWGMYMYVYIIYPEWLYLFTPILISYGYIPKLDVILEWAILIGLSPKKSIFFVFIN
jgi:hypothetical protein